MGGGRTREEGCGRTGGRHVGAHPETRKSAADHNVPFPRRVAGEGVGVWGGETSERDMAGESKER